MLVYTAGMSDLQIADGALVFGHNSCLEGIVCHDPDYGLVIIGLYEIQDVIRKWCRQRLLRKAKWDSWDIKLKACWEMVFVL